MSWIYIYIYICVCVCVCIYIYSCSFHCTMLLLYSQATEKRKNMEYFCNQSQRFSLTFWEQSLCWTQFIYTWEPSNVPSKTWEMHIWLFMPKNRIEDLQTKTQLREKSPYENNIPPLCELIKESHWALLYWPRMISVILRTHFN